MAGPTFDASPIGDIASNLSYTPTDNKAKALSIKDMMDREQLNALNLKQQKTEAATSQQIQDLLKKEPVDYSDPTSVLKTREKLNQISPKASMQFGSEVQKYQSGQVQSQIDQYELLDHQQGLIVNSIDPIVAQARDMKSKGADDMTVNAFIMQKVPGALQQLKDTKLPNGQSALAPEVVQAVNQAGPLTLSTLESFEAKTKAGKQAIEVRLQQARQATQDKSEAVRERQEDERERHDRTQENQGQQKVDLSKIKLERTTQGGLTDKSAAMLAEQVEAGDTSALTGLKPADRVKVKNLMADNAQIRGTTGADQAAANANYAGVKAGERTLGNRQANIDMAVNEAQNIGPILRKASADVPRDAFTGWNKLIQMADNADSDPKLLAFAQAAKSYANIYTRATVPGASSVFDREEAVKHLPIFTSQESFNAVLDIMDKEMAAAKKSPEQVRKSLSDAVTGRNQEAGGVAPLPGRAVPGGDGAHPPDVQALLDKYK